MVIHSRNSTVDKKVSYVGHRGYPAVYPENSLIGLRAALENGADAVELDVQFSSDRVAMLCHDASLARVSGVEKSIFECTASELEKISCGEPDRFGDKYHSICFSRLDTVADALASFEKPVFIEVKQESIERFGASFCLEEVLSASVALNSHRVIISFNLELVRLCTKHRDVSSGWVMQEYNIESLINAVDVAPNFLICDYKKIPEKIKLQKNNWQWFLYDITDPETAAMFSARGADFIETWNVKDLKE